MASAKLLRGSCACTWHMLKAVARHRKRGNRTGLIIAIRSGCMQSLFTSASRASLLKRCKAALVQQAPGAQQPVTLAGQARIMEGQSWLQQYFRLVGSMDQLVTCRDNSAAAFPVKEQCHMLPGPKPFRAFISYLPERMRCCSRSIVLPSIRSGTSPSAQKKTLVSEIP